MKRFFGVLIVLAVAVPALSGAQPAIRWDGSGAEFFSDNDGPFVNGFAFRPESNITVTALGAFDYQGDGLATPHRVGIWSTSGVLLAEATVPSGSAATLLGQFRYVSIPGLWLSAGSNYVIGASDYYGSTNDIYAYGVSVTDLAFAPGITFLHQWETNSVPGGLDFPRRADNPPNGANPGASFQFVVGAWLTLDRKEWGVQLIWPTNLADFQLEWTDHVPSTNWAGITNAPAVIGRSFVLSHTNAAGDGQFFRLRKP